MLRNDSLGLIVWEQMAFLGNPQHGCDMSPIDFAKVAEACGMKRVRIEDPSTCREKLEEGLSFDGPALIEAVVEPDEPPFGETLMPVQAQNIAQAFERGEENRERMANNLLEEDRVALSPAVQYAKDELSETSSRDG